MRNSVSSNCKTGPLCILFLSQEIRGTGRHFSFDAAAADVQMSNHQKNIGRGVKFFD
jgi:hypothetical protein